MENKQLKKKEQNRKIVVKLFGGLGNQMFQYATAKSIALDYNYELLLDISAFEQQPIGETKRNASLNIFPNIKEKYCTKELLVDMGIFTPKNSLHNLYKNLIKLFPILNRRYLIEKQYNYYHLSVPNYSFYLDGYWQSYKYFAGNHDEIRKLFDLSYLSNCIDKYLLQTIIEDLSVAMHIRRGDYLNQKKPFHNIYSIEYYYSALTELTKILGRPVKVFIFSDDIQWCKENIKLSEKHEFVTTNSGIEDFFCMSNCKHIITANSTFSWWAAWLNSNPNKIIITPSIWHKNHLAEKDDLIPPYWTKIDSN